MFHCLVIKVLFVLLSCDSSSRLSHSSALVKYFFHFLFEAFMMFVCRSQATHLLYHIFISLSTTFSHFSKLLKLFKLFIQKKQFFVTAQLEYHYKTNLSTPFFRFFYYFYQYTAELHIKKVRYSLPAPPFLLLELPDPVP